MYIYILRHFNLEKHQAFLYNIEPHVFKFYFIVGN